MRLQKVQDALEQKKIKYEYTEKERMRKSGLYVQRLKFSCMGIS